MRNKTFITAMGLMIATFIIIVFFLSNRPNINKRLSPNRVKFLRDSLEMEYYKKQLESYPYDHSKIPTDDTIK